uniref:ATP-dependent RNA helicase n=1 Tax=Neobodo designis TaxID=312471 RepID=A0A7S1PX20_NEODS|mmetsp:Transcript_23/g.72  ORF Transcript_23/g.72 Transcript_23/m.72 type:complete len:600 (+) Transcript_23:52-1851(+)
MASGALASTWGDLRLLPALTEAVLALGWSGPTTVQAASLPPLLKGQDVSLQGSTGSGKTAAFVLPIIQRIVRERQTAAAAADAPCAMVLTPSIELAEQTTEVFDRIARYVKPRIVIDNACDATRAPSASSNVIVGTPSAIAQMLKRGALPTSVVAGLRMLVIDEADVLVTMQSLAVIQRLLPSTLQTVLVSATLTEGVAAIKEQLLRNPTNITLTEDNEGPAAADGDVVVDARVKAKKHLHHHYLVATTDAHHYTLLYALFRLGLISGKTLIFVDDEEHTYKLQHFLEQLAVHTVVYDASLPLNVRLDVLKRFQRNVQGTLVCTDKTLEKAERLQVDLTAEDKETAGLTRGVDFHNVRNVILFDGIPSATAMNFAAYTHRAGRTGRAGADGNVITLFTVAQAQEVSRPLREYLRTTRDEPFRPFKKLDRGDAARIQYRADTALNNVTRNAARKLRVATVASEVARSNYLATHMSETDTSAIKKIVGKVKDKVQSDEHLMTVPTYMKVKKADSVDKYKQRVKAQHPLNRDELFNRIAKKKALDPLQRVVDTVRNKEKKMKERAAAAREKAVKASSSKGKGRSFARPPEASNAGKRGPRRS